MIIDCELNANMYKENSSSLEDEFSEKKINLLQSFCLRSITNFNWNKWLCENIVFCSEVIFHLKQTTEHGPWTVAPVHKVDV